MGAFLLLMLPLPWLLSAVLAAVIHELSHMAAVLLLGGKIVAFRIGAGGAQIEAGLSGWGRNCLAILAGPAGSLLLVVLCHWLPGVSVCGFLQGLYNLLPIRPLDGGRALEIILGRICPDRAEKILTVAQIGVFSLFLVTAVLRPAAVWLILAALFPISGGVPRNIPCKRRRFGVQ